MSSLSVTCQLITFCDIKVYNHASKARTPKVNPPRESDMLCSRCQVQALLERNQRSYQHPLTATWPFRTIQMLERNWAVVADQGPTARWHRTRGEKCDCVAVYDIKEKLKTKQKKQKRKIQKKKNTKRRLIFSFR